MKTESSDDEDASARDPSQIVLRKTWEVVGPFPSGMREHPFIATPLHAFPRTTFPDDPDVDFARRPYDSQETWASELAVGGRVGWKKFKTGQDGWTEIYYPDIRWDQLRSDRGWASLQYLVLLRTTINIPSLQGVDETPFSIDVIQGTEYAFIPTNREPEVPTRWYNGDVYNFASSPSVTHSSGGRTSNLARTISLPSGEYILLVRAAYETRLFGEPNSAPNPERGPVIRLRIQTEVRRAGVEVLEGLTIVPDVLDGWFLGKWLSVALRGGTLDRTLLASTVPIAEGITLELLEDVSIRAGQTRSIAYRITQTQVLIKDIGKIEIPLKTSTTTTSALTSLFSRIKLRRVDSSQGIASCRMTFASPSEPSYGPPPTVSYAMIITPSSLRPKRGAPASPPVILALHGAGVDAADPIWSDVIPKREGGWAVLPTGRSEWGEDWHGGSMADAWAAREALPRVLAKLKTTVSDDTLLMGHSNGGQGAWHLAARHPDRIVGLIAAAGWLTIHDYVPYIEQVSNHFADPALMGILRSSLTPYDNDLHASNLVDMPILAIHGSDDDNVTPRHSRAHIASVASWAGSHENLTMIEVPKKGHYWAEIFKMPQVIDWINKMPRKVYKETTLTCVNPLESSGRGNIRILELETPGRLARLERARFDEPHQSRATNVKKFTGLDSKGQHRIVIKENGVWQSEPLNRPAQPLRAYGPMIRLLATEAVFTIVYGRTPTLKNIALRLAHDLLVYHRIDTEILDDAEGHTRVAEGKIAGSLLCLGRADENELVEWMVGHRRIPVDFPLVDAFSMNGQIIRGAGTGIITLLPHPCRLVGLAAIIAGNDDLGVELAARLFPIRTGVTVPEWAIIHPKMRWQGAGGLLGAGFYSHDWRFNDTMSWLQSSTDDVSQITGKSRKRPRP